MKVEHLTTLSCLLGWEGTLGQARQLKWLWECVEIILERKKKKLGKLNPWLAVWKQWRRRCPEASEACFEAGQPVGQPTTIFGH